jgi:hypothetical protein
MEAGTMSNLRSETNRFKVRDQQGSEHEVIEFTPVVKARLYTGGAGEPRSTQLSLLEYELNDGTRVLKVSTTEFQTVEGDTLAASSCCDTYPYPAVDGAGELWKDK